MPYAVRVLRIGPGVLGVVPDALGRLVFQGRGVGGDVYRVLLEHCKRDDLQRALVCGREHDRGGGAVVVRAEPVHRRDAPPVSGNQSREPELRHRSRQVITDASLMLEELGGDNGADRVAAQVFGTRGATSIPVKTGQRIGATGLQLSAKHVTVAHAKKYLFDGVRSASVKPVHIRWLNADFIATQQRGFTFKTRGAGRRERRAVMPWSCPPVPAKTVPRGDTS